ncbi:MAG: thioesterase, partial [Nitrososphaerota archaeon]
MEIKPGLVLQNTYRIPHEYAAKHIGSGEVEVLATPAMILFMENTCRVGVDKLLPQTQTTVGTHVDVYHV